MAAYDETRSRPTWSRSGARLPTSQQARNALALRSTPGFQAQLDAARDPVTGQRPLNSYTLALDQLGRDGPWQPQNDAYDQGPRPPTGPSGGSGGGRGGGGGGGGGGGTPTLGQGELDWVTSLFKNRPQNQTATPYQGTPYQSYQAKPFDNKQWTDLHASLNQAGTQDAATANQAYDTLKQNLTSNYKNAFAQLPQGQSPGMDQAAMQRFLASQGVDASNMQGAQAQQGQANQAFGNLWQTLGANEDTAQANRLTTADLGRQDTLARLRAQVLGGNTGIGLQEGQARSAWDQRNDDRAYQDWQTGQGWQREDALANWQRASQVGDANTQTQNSWNTSTIQALLGLLPDLAGLGLNLPDMQALLGGQAA